MPHPRRPIYRRLALGLALTAAVAIVAAFVVDFLYHLQQSGNYPWLTPIVLTAVEAGFIGLIAYLFAYALTTAVRDRMIVAGYPQNTARVRLIIVLLISLVAVLAILGLPGGTQLTSVLFGAAVLGLILGLALQPVLSNAFAGMVIVLAAPFRVGDRVSLILAGFSPIQPSYARELSYPMYSGTVLDVGIIYTEIKLDTGEITRFPNSVVIAAPAVQVPKGQARALRIRLTFPATVSVASVEALLGEAQRRAGEVPPDTPKPRFLLADVSPSTWDGVLVIWTTDPDEAAVRDRLLRLLRAPIEPAAGASPPPPPQT